MPDPAATHALRSLALLWAASGAVMVSLASLGADVLAQAVGPPVQPDPGNPAILSNGTVLATIAAAVLAVAKIVSDAIQWRVQRLEKDQVAAAVKDLALMQAERDQWRDDAEKLEKKVAILEAEKAEWQEERIMLRELLARKTPSDFEIPTVPRRPGDSQIGRIK